MEEILEPLEVGIQRYLHNSLLHQVLDSCQKTMVHGIWMHQLRFVVNETLADTRDIQIRFDASPLTSKTLDTDVLESSGLIYGTGT